MMVGGGQKGPKMLYHEARMKQSSVLNYNYNQSSK